MHDINYCAVDGQLQSIRRVSPAEREAKAQQIKSDAETAKALNAKSKRELKALALLHRTRRFLPEVHHPDVPGLIDEIDLLLGMELT